MEILKSKIVGEDGKTKYLYLRECATCEDSQWVRFKPKNGAVCKTCRGKQQKVGMRGKNRKKEEDKIRYYYFCPTCSNIRVIDSKRKSNFCITCTQKKLTTFDYNFTTDERCERKKYYFDLATLKTKIICIWCDNHFVSSDKNSTCPSCNKRNLIEVGKKYFTICKECPSNDNKTFVIAKKQSGIKLCTKHRNYARTISGDKKKRKKTYSRIGVDGAKRNKVTIAKKEVIKPKQKFQVVDFETMEAPVKKRKEKAILISTPEQDAMMIQEYLEKGGKITREYTNE
ncbi:MAG: hypothetical protein U9N33_08135 [Campylobacterota bacterium]|nr:hypothetical protein [Campylobacterota bacterium]